MIVKKEKKINTV